jgi:endonuclease YncB( thermonuclease family)
MKSLSITLGAILGLAAPAISTANETEDDAIARIVAQDVTSTTAPIAVLSGKVRHAIDGDTLTLYSDTPPHTVKIRLADIDAPENMQNYRWAARASLNTLCEGERAVATVYSVDQYRWGWSVARVTCNGVDASAYQVRKGFAWVYREYSNDAELLELEAEARNAKRGLWAEPVPVPPWDYRKFRWERTHKPSIYPAP